MQLHLFRKRSSSSGGWPWVAVAAVFAVHLLLAGYQGSRLSRQQSDGQSPASAGSIKTAPQAEAALQEQEWADFWRSGAPEGLRVLQRLRGHFTHSQQQQRSNSSAGLDMAVAATVTQLARATGLQQQQAWLKGQVTDAVWAVLQRLQHPNNCTTARRLVCRLSKGCGFGCQIHHAVHCLANAVALGRTMVLLAQPWQYAMRQDGQAVWEALLAPVGSCGRQHVTIKPRRRGGPALQPNNPDAPEVFLDIIEAGPLPFDPPAMPPDVLSLASLFSSHPEAWWVGLLASYVLRPSAATLKTLEEHKRHHAWASPVVGVHVRRTDKVAWGEAKAQPLQDYMRQVELFCDLHLPSGWADRPATASVELAGAGMELELAASFVTPNNSSGARVCTAYLATDEPAVIEEARERYKHIHIITNPGGAAMGTMRNRQNKGGVGGIVHDVLLLSEADMFVGTFSSHVSRLAYELAQANASLDASLDFHSLDGAWVFGGSHDYELCAHTAFTADGVTRVAAGQHLVCTAVERHQRGVLECSLAAPGANRTVDGANVLLVPPGILERCGSSVLHDFRPLLPAHMRPPPGLQRNSEPT